MKPKRVEFIRRAGNALIYIGLGLHVSVVGHLLLQMKSRQLSVSWTAVLVLAFVIIQAGFVTSAMMIGRSSLRSLEAACSVVAIEQAAFISLMDDRAVLQLLGEALGMDRQELVELAATMPVHSPHPEDPKDQELLFCNAAARRALHLLECSLRRNNNLSGTALYSMLMGWLDESIIDENEPEMNNLTAAWSWLSSKQRFGKQLKAGCPICGKGFGMGDCPVFYGDQLRHDTCAAPCTSTNTTQVSTVTATVSCALETLHPGPHCHGSICWPLTAGDLRDREQHIK